MDNLVKLGCYIIIQKHKYKKLHKLNKPDGNITLGKDNINLRGIVGCQYFSVFKMIPKSNRKNKEFNLEFTEDIVSLKDEIDVKVSGLDNRNIQDDGQSQKLTANEIAELKGEANKVSDIVETLITNSNTFHNKTEFSQEKYLKKKEKKYFEYVQILKPSIRLISEIMYQLDSNKIQGIRIDTLSQIITYANIYSEGNHLLYDSGSNGLVAASLMSAIGAGTNGKLLHMHPGNMSQKQALLAMNFSEEQLNRCISVNVYSGLRQYYQGCDTNSNDKIADIKDENLLKRKADEDNTEHINKIPKLDDTNLEAEGTKESTSLVTDETISENIENKPRIFSEPKKPKWHFDNIAASDILENKMDSLVIVCKEDPQNIFEELVNFVKPGRPFVIYYNVAEPLQKLYMDLKTQSNVAALKLTCNWLRNYQILPERTHPDVMMNGSSGFLLTGYVLK